MEVSPVSKTTVWLMLKCFHGVKLVCTRQKSSEREVRRG